MEDIEIHDQKLVRILIRRSKNDPLGIGRVARISPRSFKLLNDWLKASNIGSGPVFRAIKYNVVSTSGLHAHSVNRILKKCAAAAGMPEATTQRLSGHSMRIGAAQDMVKLGVDILPIMIAGGWKTTNIVARYVENADISDLLHKFYLHN